MQSIYYIILAIVKVIDNIILTGKTILTQKNKAIAASILVVISQFIFYIVVKQIVEDNNFISIAIVSIASGVGSYIAFYINKKVSKDTVYVNIITSNERTKMKELGDYVRAEGIKIVTFDAYSDDLERTLTALVFANTKEQSSKIDRYIEQHDGFFREVV
jgi:uncharacterized protein YebE (UPF0316 family)